MLENKDRRGRFEFPEFIHKFFHICKTFCSYFCDVFIGAEEEIIQAKLKTYSILDLFFVVDFKVVSKTEF